MRRRKRRRDVATRKYGMACRSIQSVPFLPPKTDSLPQSHSGLCSELLSGSRRRPGSSNRARFLVVSHRLSFPDEEWHQLQVAFDKVNSSGRSFECPRWLQQVKKLPKSWRFCEEILYLLVNYYSVSREQMKRLIHSSHMPRAKQCKYRSPG